MLAAAEYKASHENADKIVYQILAVRTELLGEEMIH